MLFKLTQWLVLAGLSLLTVSGCSSSSVAGAYPQAPPGAVQGGAVGGVTGAAVAGLNGSSIPLGIAVGALLGMPIGSYRDDTGAIKQLAAAGITVVRLGDIVQVVIPHDIVFDPEIYEIKRSAQPILNQVVALLVQYPDVNMAVVGHSDNVGTEDDQQSRSDLQAQAIMSYIWSHGIPINRLSFYGVGSTDTDASLKYAIGQSYNRRVVIAFWRKGKPGPINGLLGQNPDCWTKADPDECNSPGWLSPD